MGVVARTLACVAMGGALVVSLLVTSAPALAQAALLDALSTRVTLAHPGAEAADVAVEQIIRSGDTVATDETGRALVTYPDGSTALLDPSSALTIEFVQTTAGDYAVRMQQTLGRVWYAVTRAVTLGGRYEVRTAGMASVIRAGSDSYVTVSPSGETTLVTISGTVDTTAAGAEVAVPAGSSRTANPPQPVPPSGKSAPVAAQPAPSTSSGNASAPKAPTPTSTPRATVAPSPTTAFVPPVTTLPPLSVVTAGAKPKTPTPSVRLPVATPKPAAAPTPAPTQIKDEFGSGKDALRQPRTRNRESREDD
ncbi:MAG: hypothetical protein E6I18_11880 [Chloroflexi bacterium]|nr:MAG: hypothetical protein E6I18_11880 [Chloroflexota bacterium]